MKIKRIHIENFKSLVDVDIELGRLNVFIGANGTGKTSILEALGIISATMADRMDDRLLDMKGVRLSTPNLYKSSFRGMPTPKLMKFQTVWDSNNNKEYQYSFSIGAPQGTTRYTWRLFAENFLNLSEDDSIFGRSNGSKEYGIFDGISVPNDRSMYGLLRGAKTETLEKKNIIWDDIDIVNQLKDYIIYSPNMFMLRGIQDDSRNILPIGIHGSRLPEATGELMRFVLSDSNKSEEVRTNCLDLVFSHGMYSSLEIGAPNLNIMSNNIKSSRFVLRFTEKYMKETRNTITASDANEGALFNIFLACLLFHPEAPSVFAIDNFDFGLNPRVARHISKMFSRYIPETNRTVLLTTHNPLVLDGLDINNDNVKLFTVDRDREGKTFIKPVKISSNLIDNQAGKTLSSLWLSGRLGGMPNL